MKKHFLPLLATLAVLAAATPARADLDFTLRYKTTTADAIKVSNPYITDGNNKIYLMIPNLWKIFDSPKVLECIPNTANSKVRLESMKNSKPVTIDQAGGKLLLTQITGQIPEGAKSIETMPLDINPLPIFQWQDLEATVRYELFGQKMRHSIMHVQMLLGRVVELSVTAPEEEFDHVHQTARSILSTWFEPSRDLPPEMRDRYETPDVTKS